MSGIEALRIVRSRFPDLPFIICSGKFGETTAVQAMQAGANDYLLKDDLSRLKSAVLHAIAEAEERQHRRKVENELALLKHAIDMIPIGVTITDPTTGTIIYTNAAEAEMHGYSITELMEMDPRHLAPKNLWNEQRKPLENYVTLVRESVNIRKDGSEFPVQIISMPVNNGAEKPLGLITICEDITKRKEIENRLSYMSTHDALTGLFNRAYFEQEMTRLDRSRHFPISVIMIDVNGLKEVNDQAGHHAGDLLLQEVGRILAEMFRAEDLLARIGGDEFIVLLPETDEQTVEKAIIRIQKYLQEYPQKEGEPRVSLAMGHATAAEPGTLTKCVNFADKLMYLDKKSHPARRRKDL
jgi:diguanylate cyclase (GGDEF)-like protein/PAS domain S-box-containing protein